MHIQLAINEVTAVELLRAGEQQQARYRVQDAHAAVDSRRSQTAPGTVARHGSFGRPPYETALHLFFGERRHLLLCLYDLLLATANDALAQDFRRRLSR